MRSRVRRSARSADTSPKVEKKVKVPVVDAAPDPVVDAAAEPPKKKATKKRKSKKLFG